MSKQTLTATTPHGTFTRTTETAYQFVAVGSPNGKFKSPEDFMAKCNGSGRPMGGVYGRVFKDRGYLVSWHSSREAAERALAKGNNSYIKGEPLGVYAVDGTDAKVREAVLEARVRS